MIERVLAISTRTGLLDLSFFLNELLWNVWYQGCIHYVSYRGGGGGGGDYI